jgi:glycine oxidase
MSVTPRSITVAGAGIFGLWQALTLARAGHRVRLLERSPAPFAAASSRLAGAMLCPDCEAESAPVLVRELGHRGLQLWRAAYPDLILRGSLVVAHARDTAELARFAHATVNHQTVDAVRLAGLEPDLAERYASALHYPDEAHMITPDALRFLLAAARQAGVEVELGVEWRDDADRSLVIDCRGFAARDDLRDLRGVRGERLVIRTPDVSLSRPVRLLHPRFPLYVVPWSENRFLVGATLIESEDQGPVTVRSALELLGLVYALHPGFGEAEILEAAAGLRPAFPDNVPRAVPESATRIRVNGAWRHGFLLAPVLAEAVAAYVADERVRHPLLVTH